MPKQFRYSKCHCPVVGQSFPTRCPKHGNRIDLKPVTVGGRTHTSDDRNKAQKRYGTNHLELLKRAGEILDYKLNHIRFLIGKHDNGRNAWAKPDYAVWLPDRRLRMIEFKGFWEIAAKVRIKNAVLLYPYIEWWVAYEERDGSYRHEIFGNGEG